MSTRAGSATAAEEAEAIARWLADRESAPITAAPHDIARVALRLRGEHDFRRRIESLGAEAATQGLALAALTSTAIHRLGQAGSAYLERLDPAQHAPVLRQLTDLQAAVVQALIRGYASVVPINATPSERERLLNDTIVALDRINATVNSSLELEEVLRLTVETAADLLEVPEVTIYLYDPAIDRLILRATKAFNPEAVGHTTLALGEGIVGWAAEAGQPVVVRDVWADPRFKYMPGLGEESMRSFMAVPIVLYTANRLVGVVNITSSKFRDFTAEEVRFAEITAGQLAIAVENARLHQQTDEALRRNVEQLTSVQNLTRTLVSNLDLQSVLAQIVRQAAELTDMEKAAIWRIDEERKLLRIVSSYNLGPSYTQHTLGLGEGVVGLTLETRAPVVVNDALNDERLQAPRELIAEEGYGAMFSVPLIVGDRALGAISLYSAEPREFTQEQVGLAFTFGNQAAIALENARLFEEVRGGFDTKSLLLQELHHRVKNNMQTIASLLTLQARHAKTDEAASLLKLSAGRIAGMARVHDLLSQENVGSTTIGAVIEAMADLMRIDLGASGREIELTVQAEPARIASEKATVFALAVNELLWNAVEHGLNGRSRGSIHVEAVHEGDAVRVSVSDDGQGLPPDFALDRDMGLGLSIVGNLVERNLNGSFSIEPRDGAAGAVATLRFTP